MSLLLMLLAIAGMAYSTSELAGILFEWNHLGRLVTPQSWVDQMLAVFAFSLSYILFNSET